MTKIGVGVGEEFPVDEPPPPKPDPERDAALEARERYWRRHHYLHVATRVAFIALIAALIVWMFVAPLYVAPIAASGAVHHPHFFFPFFPLLLILLFAFAWRRRAGCHYGHHHWHDEPRSRDRTEA